MRESAQNRHAASIRVPRPVHTAARKSALSNFAKPFRSARAEKNYVDEIHEGAANVSCTSRERGICTSEALRF